MAGRYSDETVQAYQARFPQLWERVMSAGSPAKVGAAVRQIRKALDNGTLDILACDGAIEVFKTVASEEFAAVRGCSRSLDEIRADRILHTGARDQAGRRVARKW